MTARDDGERVGYFEPLMISDNARLRSRLNDLALTLAEKSAAFSSSLPPVTAASLSEVVAIANCYYSNLVEGHDVRPIDIERAMHGNYSDDAKKRDLQLEARAHITVQKWIDSDGIAAAPFSTEAICEIHRRFCELLPPELLLVKTGKGDEKVSVEPGALRTRDVKVGRHLAISPGSVPRFLGRLEQSHKSLGRIDRILSAACGHHRLLWVHPFLDGNGRVARFVSHAALKSSLTTSGPWSLARGLARRENEYRTHLAYCDEPRRGSLYGRGTLSESALANFAEFFLETCIDQVDFMSGLMQPHKLHDRVLTWAHEEIRSGTLPRRADAVLTAILYRGELGPGEIVRLTGPGQRSIQRVTPALVKSGVIRSEPSSSRLRFAFPIGLATRFLPRFFPEDR